MAVKGELIRLGTASYALWFVEVARFLFLFMLGKRLEVFLRAGQLVGHCHDRLKVI
jgi:hypothetical protein